MPVANPKFVELFYACPTHLLDTEICCQIMIFSMSIFIYTRRYMHAKLQWINVGAGCAGRINL